MKSRGVHLRGFAGLAAVGLVAALTACASAADENGPPKLVVNVTTQTPEGTEAWELTATAFEKANPGVEVDIIVVPDQNWGKLRLQVQQDTAGDLSQISDDDAFNLSPAFLAIDDVLTDEVREDVDPYAWEGFQVGPSPRLVTPVFRPTTIIYNKTLFAEAGVEAPTSFEDAWSWDEFTAALEKLTVDEDGDGNPEVYGMSAPFSLAQLFSYSNGGSGPYNADMTSCRMTDDDVVEAYQSFADLRLVDKVMPLDVESSDTRRIFSEGRAAITMGTGGTELSVIDPAIDWDIMPMPAFKTESVTVSNGNPIGVLKTSKNPELAKKFLSFILAPETQELLFDSGLGLPVSASAAEAAVETLQSEIGHPELYFQALDQRVDLHTLNALGDEFIERFVRVSAREIFLGQRTAEEAMAEQCEAFNVQIERFGPLE